MDVTSDFAKRQSLNENILILLRSFHPFICNDPGALSLGVLLQGS